MKTLFIISVVFCSIMGGFFSIIVDANLMEKKKTWKRIVVGLLVAVSFGFTFTCVMFGEAKADDTKWNSGICIECNGNYKFNGASKHRSTNYYYYTCDKCDYTIELKNLRNN